MSGGWAGSNRKQELPADWPRRRRRVLNRDGHRCQHRERPGAPICGAHANQVDHIIRGADHRPENLQALCEPHHRVKSAREGGQSFTPLRRPPEPHPAL
jgi:5-methylcytosine-specific restriction protein A